MTEGRRPLGVAAGIVDEETDGDETSEGAETAAAYEAWKAEERRKRDDATPICMRAGDVKGDCHEVGGGKDDLKRGRR